MRITLQDDEIREALTTFIVEKLGLDDIESIYDSGFFSVDTPEKNDIVDVEEVRFSIQTPVIAKE